jgi:hypothetical protein
VVSFSGVARPVTVTLQPLVRPSSTSCTHIDTMLPGRHRPKSVGGKDEHRNGALVSDLHHDTPHSFLGHATAVANEHNDRFGMFAAQSAMASAT